ncbi:MAG TPA: esterase-like activity of phytase family protein, partial [Propionibacteriaceae bacterium]
MTAAALSATVLLPNLSAQAAPREPLDQGRWGHQAGVTTPTLVKRATLSADFRAPGPPSGAKATAANGRTGPFPGQVIPGFSGMVNNGDGTFWALPDNGFGAKANSADFLLRLYLVRPRWETAAGGRGQIKVLRHISLSDPGRKAGFEIVNQDTRRRLLTGADFDIESVVRAKDGSFWIGEEFGPFLLHVSATGRLLAAPVPLPGVTSPDNPFLGGQTPTLPRSRGFEAMAASKDGRRLFPIVEGALDDDPDRRRRLVLEFDVRHNRYTGRTWAYQTDQGSNVVGDAHLTGKNELLVIERDDF